MKNLIQLIAALVSTAGFCLMYHLTRRHIPLAAGGAAACWAVYLLLRSRIGNLFYLVLLVSIFSAAYAEIAAKYAKAPATLFLIPALIPLVPGSYVYYMMLDDGVPAGFIGLVPHKEGKMFLSKLYVSAAHRSRGLPRAAFDFIETLCQAEKLPAIYLTVNKKNFHAIEVYKYFGFHQTDAVVTDIGSGFVMNDYIMQKDL